MIMFQLFHYHSVCSNPPFFALRYLLLYKLKVFLNRLPLVCLCCGTLSPIPPREVSPASALWNTSHPISESFWNQSFPSRKKRYSKWAKFFESSVQPLGSKTNNMENNKPQMNEQVANEASCFWSLRRGSLEELFLWRGWWHSLIDLILPRTG